MIDKPKISFFIVDGSHTNLADIIIKERTTGERVDVLSYGFGIKQIDRLLANFNTVNLLLDDSHARINKSSFLQITNKAKRMLRFNLSTTKNHAKIAIVDSETLIFTSANLSCNRAAESYMILNINDVDGSGSINDLFSEASKVVDAENSIDSELLSFNDCSINL